MNALLFLFEHPLRGALCGIVLIMGIGNAGAATITLTATDAANSTSFNAAGNWSDGLAPATGKDYSVSSFTLRTPLTANNAPFAGSSLTMTNGGILAYKGPGSDTLTVNNLILTNGGAVANYSSSTTFTLAGNITLSGTSATYGVVQNNANIGYTVSAVISGAGGLRATTNYASTVTNAVILTGTNLYTGGTQIQNKVLLDVQSASGLGTGNVVVLSGGQLKLESNQAIGDTAELSLASLAAGSITLAFSGTETIGSLSFDGTTLAAAGTYGAVGSGAQFTDAVFTGTGILSVVPEPPAAVLLGLAAVFLLGAAGRSRRPARA